MKQGSAGSKLILLLLSTIPFAAGRFLDYAVNLHTDETPPFKIIGIGMLLLWCLIAYIMRSRMKDMEELIVWQNMIPLIVLILLCVQELIFRSYWPGMASIVTQEYYLPVLIYGYTLTTWTGRTFAAYIASFLLMIIATFLGGTARESKLKK
ncbi:MAG: hypothetical protein IK035_06570 [Firmicutes bacterium]|nr:hypothetical protein [Bacillota bacterium]